MEVLLNAILVNENVRPAMMIQAIDYNETNHRDPKTKSIINKIKYMFPDLIFSDNYEHYQGVIISKTKSFNGCKNISDKRMGKILGYPCTYANYVAISLNVMIKKKPITLFACACGKQYNRIKFQSLATEAKRVFKMTKYKDMLSNIEINDVYVEVKLVLDRREIINHIIDDKELNSLEIDEIKNILLNYSFSNKLHKYFQYTNKIHRGILLNLLVNADIDILSAFYPLQNHPNEFEIIKETIIMLEQRLINILKKTTL
jgi:hypothetical protein